MKHLNLLSEYSPEHTWTVGVGEIKHTINTAFASTTNYLSHFIFMAYILTNADPLIVTQARALHQEEISRTQDLEPIKDGPD